MPWDVLSDEQREVRELVRALARERIAPRAAEIDESHEFPWDVVELFREHGIFGLFFDEEYGGTGTGTLLALVAIEEVSKVCATSGLILAVQELGSLGLKLAGSEEQKERYLPRLASGEWLAAYALTEAGSGSDSAAMRTTARRDGRRVRPRRRQALHHERGRRRASTRSSRRPTRRRGTPGSPRSSSSPTRRASRSRGSSRRWGSRARRPASSSSTAAASRPANLLGEEGEGFRIAMRILDRSRPGVAAQALGIAQGATDYALEYAKTRETMGKPIAAAPADRGQARRHGDETARRRAGCSTASGGWSTRASPDDELTKASAMAKLLLRATSRWR